MKKNIGTLDKVIRTLISSIIAILYFTNTISGILGLVLMIFAGIFLLTSFVSSCPLYFPFKINTHKKNV